MDIHGPLQTRGETRCPGGVSVSCLASHTCHETLNACLRNLVGMKCSWPGTCIKVCFGHICPGADPVRGKIGHGGRGGPLHRKASSSDRKATATNRIHSIDLEACVMKCCCFWFHSVVKFLTLESSL